MYLEMLDFLMENKYVELSHWSEKILERNKYKLNQDQRTILNHLKNRNLPQLINFIKKKRFTTTENETIVHIYKQIKQNKEKIDNQWNFLEKIDKDTDFLNLILDEDIVVHQKEESVELFGKDLEKENDFKRRMEILKNATRTPENLIFGGEIYHSSGLSSINNLQAVYNNIQVQEDLQRFQKYEKIIQFIDNLELPLQKLFSKNQIGIIIYQKQIYLIKWVQYISEDQLITGEISTDNKVSVLENFGIKIGVHLKPSFELGNLVVFRNREDEAEEDIETNREDELYLKPLLSLDEELFSYKSRCKKEKYSYDLSDEEDCELFVQRVLDRIEMGILLLTKGSSKVVKSDEDLDLYIRISLQKVDGMDSINQRINILRELISVNKNPDLTPKIKQKLEHNYILLLKSIFKIGNTKRLPDILKILDHLNLFDEDIGILLQTIIYLIDFYYVESNTILKSIEFISNTWELTKKQYKLLEKPQISAITNIVVEKLDKGRFSEVLKYLNEYISKHPQFRSYNILTLIIEILIEIFRKKYQLEKNHFTNEKYINFLNKYSEMVDDNKKQMNDEEIVFLKQRIEDSFLLLSQDVDFISYIDSEISNFLNILIDFDKDFVSERMVFQILKKMVDLVPLSVFHNIKPQLGSNFLSFLMTNYEGQKLKLKFMTNFIKYFKDGGQNLKKNKSFFKETSDMLLDFKGIIKNLDMKEIFLLPFKKEIKKLLKSWYLDKNVPQNNFSIHKNIITTWINYTDLQEDFTHMINILSIKDLIWSCKEGKIPQVRKKYKKLPKSVFEENLKDLIEELSNIISTKFTNSKELSIIKEIFTYFHKDYDKFRLSSREFDEIVGKYVSNVEKTVLFFIEKGNHERFKKTFELIDEYLIYFSESQFNNILNHFKLIYTMELEEGEKFNLRIQMMKTFVSQIKLFLKKYDKIYKRKKKLISDKETLISRDFLEVFYSNVMEGSYEIFQKAQQWLLFVSKEEFLTYDKAYKPMKELFKSIIEQFTGKKQRDIFEDLKVLSKDIFQNQTMLNENKKKFFKMIIKVLPEEDYPEFYPEFNKYLEFINEISDVEALYFTIQPNNKNKMQSLKERLKKLIDLYSHLFVIWFIYGNILALEEKYDKAIEIYNKALKYDQHEPTSTRLYHNLIVAHLSTGKVDDAIEIIKGLPIGIRTNPIIKSLIQHIEEKVGIELQSRV